MASTGPASAKRVVDSDKVWTALITNEAYMPGLLTLNHSLRQVSSAYPFVALYTDTLPQRCLDALKLRGIPFERIDYILPASSRDYASDPRFLDCWTKLTPFSMTHYTRIVQLDADMLVLRNMDELMTLHLDDPALAASASPESVRVMAAGHACVCNPLKKPHYPHDWTPQNCAFTTQHSNPTAAQTIAPASTASPLGYLNGGLQVVNPSKEIFAQIQSYMESHAAEMDFADQSVLSELFAKRWVPLPYIYNALKTLRWPGVHDAIWRDDEVKNVHYILAPKPWNEIDDEGNLREGVDESHRWWADVNLDRRRFEKDRGIPEFVVGAN